MKIVIIIDEKGEIWFYTPDEKGESVFIEPKIKKQEGEAEGDEEVAH